MGRWLALLIVLAGCGAGSEQVAAPPSQAKNEASSLTGPEGKVTIGSTLEEAKRAFPPPSGAEIFDRSMSLAQLKKEGWAWGAGEGTGFEVALEGGKIVAMTFTDMDGPPPADTMEVLKRQLGQPKTAASSTNVEVAVWESGENARYTVFIKNDKFVMGPGTITVIAPKAALKMLGYDPEDPQKFADSVDETIRASQRPQ